MGTALLGAQRASTAAMFCLAVTLVVIWPLPHFMALKNILFVSLLSLLLWAQYKDRQYELLRVIVRLPLVTLAALIAWLFAVAFWVDKSSFRSLDGIKGEWLPAIVSFIIGFLLLPTLVRGGMDCRRVLRTLFWALMALTVAQLLVASWYFVFEGRLPGFFGGISDHKANITYITSIALGLLVPDVLTRMGGSRFLGLSARTQLLAFAVLATVTYLSGARNGILVFLLVAILGATCLLIMASRLSRKATLIGALVVGLCIIIALWAMIKVDARWARFLSTVPVAWDVEKNHAWLDTQTRGLPIASDGLPVEVNAYERIAWARVALHLLAEHPLGSGITKSSFKELVEEKYGETLAAHSHNGYLDFALSAGIPGLAIWLLFLFVLLRAGISSFKATRAGGGAALVLIVVAFSVRSGLDSILRDHILEEFLFFSGLLLAASTSARGTTRTANA